MLSEGAQLGQGSEGLFSRSLLEGKLVPCWQQWPEPGLRGLEINIRTVLKDGKNGRRWIKQCQELQLERRLSEMEGVCEKQQNGSRREINTKILQTDTVDSRMAEETRGRHCARIKVHSCTKRDRDTLILCHSKVKNFRE